jgi:hypothetical protein
MTKSITAIVVIVLILAFYYYFHSPHNTEKIKACATCDSRLVHSAYDDKKEAAALIDEINRRNKLLLDHLREKYHSKTAAFDPSRANKIDVIFASRMYSEDGGVDNKKYTEYLQDRVDQLVEHYDGNNITEISPLNPENLTAYTENKKKLVLCLRSKTADSRGHHKLHDINTMMFVVLHELAHMMNAEWDHATIFWELFRFLLQNGAEVGIYRPIDYHVHPVTYCGMEIKYNPMYDSRL